MEEGRRNELLQAEGEEVGRWWGHKVGHVEEARCPRCGEEEAQRVISCSDAGN